MSSNREGQGTQKSGQKPNKENDRDNQSNEQSNEQRQREHGHDARVQQREKGPKPSR
jgi:hypothetical protein